jgi:hypothetical protein
VAVLQQDVLGLDIAMHDALRMRCAKRVGHLTGNQQRIGNWQLPLPLEARTQRLAAHIGHDIEQQAVGIA